MKVPCEECMSFAACNSKVQHAINKRELDQYNVEWKVLWACTLLSEYMAYKGPRVEGIGDYYDRVHLVERLYKI